jgi:hypothetical protein
MQHTNTLYGKNEGVSFVKAGGTHSNHWALKGYINYTDSLEKIYVLPAVTTKISLV